MTLEYNPSFSEVGSEGWFDGCRGYFINPKNTNIDILNMLGECHNKDSMVRIFDDYFNPYPSEAFYNKDYVIMNLVKRIKCYIEKGYALPTKYNFSNYCDFVLLSYFLKAYQSPNTKMWNNGMDVVELGITTGYNPKFDYSEYNMMEDYYGYKTRYISKLDKLNIIKSILIQYGNIDSIESSMHNTILTSKFNVYEYFYNYLLMDYDIIILPKKTFDRNHQIFVDYEQNKFLKSDKEIRLKDEIQSIRKLVKIGDRVNYFR